MSSLVIAVALGTAVGAIAQPVVLEPSAPALRAGDAWSYRILDNYTGQERSTYAIKVTQVDADGYQIERQAGGKAETRRLTLGLNLTQVVDGVAGDTGELRFPLVIGAKWRSQAWFDNAKGIGGIEDLAREVVAIETVKVPAGEFVAFKIVARGQWVMKTDRSNIMIGNPSGRVEKTVWYAPAAKAFVAAESVTVAQGHMGDRRRVELTRLDLQ